MKIGLYDVDGHNWPNLCLMKLSTYHKAQGDDVEMWSPELTNIHDFRRLRVYVLVNYNSTHEQDLYRVDTLRAMGYDPYVMVYERPSAPLITRQLQRWVNNKRIFRAVPHFADYVPSMAGGGKRA